MGSGGGIIGTVRRLLQKPRRETMVVCTSGYSEDGKRQSESGYFLKPTDFLMA